MSATISGAKAHSKSLYNVSIAPGWTQEEVEILRLALQKFGIGKWCALEKSQCLPSKTIQQMYLQTQRMLGQQSLAAYMGLHVNIRQVFEDNMKKPGLRKYNCLVNEGDKLTAEMKRRLIAENERLYGLEPEEVEAIELPSADPQALAKILTLEQIVQNKSRFSTMEVLKLFQNLEEALQEKLVYLENQQTYRPCLGVIEFTWELPAEVAAKGLSQEEKDLEQDLRSIVYTYKREVSTHALLQELDLQREHSERRGKEAGKKKRK